MLETQYVSAVHEVAAERPSGTALFTLVDHQSLNKLLVG
jgi:hypothetical protein